MISTFSALPDFLSRILDALPQHVAVLDSAATVVMVNEAWKRFGKDNGAGSGTSGVGSNYRRVCETSATAGCTEAVDVASAIDKLLVGRDLEFHIDYPCHSPQKPRWFAARMRRFVSDGSVWIIVTHQDITERTVTLAALEQARALAQEASAAKGAFLANVSHEIRTPLSGILGLTDLALETELNAEQAEYLNLTRAASLGLLRLVNQLLDFSKVEAGKLTLQCVEFAVRSCVGETVDELAVLARQKGLSLTAQVSPDAPALITGDPDRLRQVLVNLIGNAIKFTSEGSVRVRVESDAATGGLRFSVADSGIGISPDKRQFIFEPFAQLAESSAGSTTGTGLGLALSADLVKAMGGEIGVESTPGKGSTFSFVIPIGAPITLAM